MASRGAQGSLTVENLLIEREGFKLRIPQIVLEGSSNTQADVRALFDLNAATSWTERVSRITARSISIPTIEMTHGIAENVSSVTTYSGSVLRDVRSGVIAEMDIRHAQLRAAKTRTGGKTSVITTITENYRHRQFDLPQLLRFLFDQGGANEPLRTVITESVTGTTTFDGGTMASSRSARAA